MDNYFNTSHTFDSEPWLSVSETVVRTELEKEKDCSEHSVNTADDKSVQKGRHITAPVLTFQLVICMLILIFLFITKTFFAHVFSEIKFIFDREIGASMYFSGDFSHLDYSEFFEATSDEI